MSSVLDSFGRVDIEHAWPRVNSRYQDGVLLQHVRNGDLGNRVRRTFTLSWASASQSLGYSIGEHYGDNAHAAFSVTLPGETVTCIYADRPTLNYTTATDCSITVRLDEALNTDA